MHALVKDEPPGLLQGNIWLQDYGIFEVQVEEVKRVPMWCLSKGLHALECPCRPLALMPCRALWCLIEKQLQMPFHIDGG